MDQIDKAFINEKRRGNTYFNTIKGSDEVEYDELHLLTFCNNNIPVRKRFEIPKNVINYNPKLEETLSEYIKLVVEYSGK